MNTRKNLVLIEDSHIERNINEDKLNVAYDGSYTVTCVCFEYLPRVIDRPKYDSNAGYLLTTARVK
jgi:hypothetical protein